MSLTLLDGILIGVMLVSAFLAMMRGFVREVLAIGAWVAAVAAAYFLYSYVTPYIEPYISNDTISIAIAAGAIFFVTLIDFSIITIRISDMVLYGGAGPVDRTLGLLFGAARGFLIMVVLIMFFNNFVTRDNQPDFVKNAYSLPFMNEIGTRIEAALPDDLLTRISKLIGLGEDAPEEQPATDGTPEVDEIPDESSDLPESTIPQEDSRSLERAIETAPSTN